MTGAPEHITALVLRTRPLGEADLIVSLLREDGRRLELLARSGRASHRRFGGCLQPFSQLRLHVGRRRGHRLPPLEEATLLDGHLPIRQHLRRLGQAAYAMELAECFALEEEANPELWRMATGVLSVLEQRALTEPELAYLELRALQAAGLTPVLSGCLRCGRPQAESWRADTTGQGFYCNGCAPPPASGRIEPAAIDFLRSLQQRQLPARVAVAACRQARSVLQAFLSTQAGRSFRALEFLRQLPED